MVDGSVRVELTRGRRGQDGRLGPALLVSVSLVNLILALDVRLEILTDQEVIALAETRVTFQRTQEFFEFALFTERARSDVLDGIQEGLRRYEFPGGSFLSRRFDFVFGDTEQKKSGRRRRTHGFRRSHRPKYR